MTLPRDENGNQIWRNDVAYGWISLRIIDDKADPPFDHVVRLNRDLYSHGEEARVGARIDALRVETDRWRLVMGRTMLLQLLLARQDPTWTAEMIKECPAQGAWVIFDFLGQLTRSEPRSETPTGTETTPVGNDEESSMPSSVETTEPVAA